MKTTLDLPDALMREVKIRAVHERKKLKDAIAEFIRKGMAAGKARPPKAPKPVKLRDGRSDFLCRDRATAQLDRLGRFRPAGFTGSHAFADKRGRRGFAFLPFAPA